MDSTTGPDVATPIVRALIARLGGRFSTEAGIDVDAGPREVDRWFLAATLLGSRISATIAMRTYRALHAAGVDTISDAGQRDGDALVDLLDEGGYTRYDDRTATRLHDLAATVASRHPAGIAAFGASIDDPAELAEALDALPGWGPVTVSAFLRELRGVWLAADPPVTDRTARAAACLGLAPDESAFDTEALTRLATRTDVDVRDLEAALTRLTLAHGRRGDPCRRENGTTCRSLAGTPE